MAEDAKFFKMLSNVEDEEKNIRKSNNEPKLVNAYEFWDQVETKYIQKLGEPSAYKYDLEFFGYSIQEYAEDIGITL